MTLKQIAKAVKANNPQLTCRIQEEKTQIYLKSDLWKGEQAALLSPSYQQKIEADIFSASDLEEIMVEADRIYRIGH